MLCQLTKSIRCGRRVFDVPHAFSSCRMFAALGRGSTSLPPPVFSSRIMLGHNVQLAALAAYVPSWDKKTEDAQLCSTCRLYWKNRECEILLTAYAANLLWGYAIWISREVESRGISDVRKDRALRPARPCQFSPPMIVRTGCGPMVVLQTLRQLGLWP